MEIVYIILLLLLSVLIGFITYVVQSRIKIRKKKGDKKIMFGKDKKPEKKELMNTIGAGEKPAENKTEHDPELMKRIYVMLQEEKTKPGPQVSDAPVKAPEPVEVRKPVNELIEEKIKEYGGSLAEVWKYVIGNLHGEELATAGYQICLIQVNNRLDMENRQRKLINDYLHGVNEIPFDPRMDPVFVRLVTAISKTK